MWTMIPSLELLIQSLAPAFTLPSFATQGQLLIAWFMCLGRHTEYRVFQTALPATSVSHAQRHPFDRFYNFFSRSAWSLQELAFRVAVSVVVRLSPEGWLYLIVDDTLLHKRGLHVYGRGWFRDAVASTRKRVATASGHNWVIRALAIPVPCCPSVILALTITTRLHLPGKDQPSCVELARMMLSELLGWFPERRIILIGDGAYAAAALLERLDRRVSFVGRMRGDAALFDPTPRPVPKGRRGPKPKKGPRLPKPKEAAAQADRNRTGRGPWAWQPIEVMAYGVQRTPKVLSYEVVWPTVLGLSPIRVVVVRDPSGRMRDAYLFTTDLKARLQWVVETFARRWAIEVSFKASKQVLEIEAPRHWSQESIEKLAPWVWLMRSVLQVWYLTAGRLLPEAERARAEMGEWDSEWSLRHMLNVLRAAILEATIKMDLADLSELKDFISMLKNCLKIAA
jgi:hypothetical protein